MLQATFAAQLNCASRAVSVDCNTVADGAAAVGDGAAAVDGATAVDGAAAPADDDAALGARAASIPRISGAS